MIEIHVGVPSTYPFHKLSSSSLLLDNPVKTFQLQFPSTNITISSIPHLEDGNIPPTTSYCLIKCTMQWIINKSWVPMRCASKDFTTNPWRIATCVDDSFIGHMSYPKNSYSFSSILTLFLQIFRSFAPYAMEICSSSLTDKLFRWQFQFALHFGTEYV